MKNKFALIATLIATIALASACGDDNQSSETNNNEATITGTWRINKVIIKDELTRALDTIDFSDIEMLWEEDIEMRMVQFSTNGQASFIRCSPKDTWSNGTDDVTTIDMPKDTSVLNYNLDGQKLNIEDNLHGESASFIIQELSTDRLIVKPTSGDDDAMNIETIILIRA